MLLLWGFLLCQGSPASKALLFSDFLYPGDTVSSEDPSLQHSLNLAIDLSTILINKFEPLTSEDPKLTPEFDEDDIMQIELAKPRIFETFLDDVFGSDSILERQAFLRRIARCALYLFDAQACRDRIQNALLESFREE